MHFAKSIKIVNKPELAETVVAIDMANLSYRAAWANIDLKTSTGIFSGAVFGSVKIIASSLRQIGITGNVYLYYAWEGRNAKKPRRAILPDYKQRDKKIENPTHSVMSVFQFAPGFHAVADQKEGDDCLAYAAWHYHETHKVVVLSGDKDMWGLLQLPNVSIYSWNRSAYITNKDVYEEFHVNNPAKVYLAKAFFGDPSDGIKGVHGIRKKQIEPILNLESVNVPEDVYAEVATGKWKLTKSTSEKLEDFQMAVHKNWLVVKPNVGNFTWQIEPVIEGNEEEFRETLIGYECNSLLDSVPFFFGASSF